MTAQGKTARGRVYKRKFDYDEAVRRRAAGETLAALAAEFGISVQAIRLATDERARTASEARSYAHQRSFFCACGAQAFKKNGVARCRECASKAMATNVRDRELRCVTCGEWKPDRDFAHNRTNPARRGRHTQCRPCNTIAKRAWRKRTGRD